MGLKIKIKGHSVQKLRVETDGQTEAIALPPVLMRSAITRYWHGQYSERCKSAGYSYPGISEITVDDCTSRNLCELSMLGWANDVLIDELKQSTGTRNKNYTISRSETIRLRR